MSWFRLFRRVTKGVAAGINAFVRADYVTPEAELSSEFNFASQDEKHLIGNVYIGTIDGKQEVYTKQIKEGEEPQPCTLSVSSTDGAGNLTSGDNGESTITEYVIHPKGKEQKIDGTELLSILQKNATGDINWAIKDDNDDTVQTSFQFDLKGWNGNEVKLGEDLSMKVDRIRNVLFIRGYEHDLKNIQISIIAYNDIAYYFTVPYVKSLAEEPVRYPGKMDLIMPFTRIIIWYERD